MTEFNKNYATQDEYMGRLQIFSHNLEKLNEKFSTESTYQMKINEFSDRTPEEMNSMKGFRPTPSFLMAEPTVLDTTNLASSINWVQKGAVTDPKNQGHCGSCWSFSTTGAMEGHHQIVSGDLVSLSEQQLVDCSAMNGGCQGGDMMTAFYYAMDHPLATEESYPYTAVQGTC